MRPLNLFLFLKLCILDFLWQLPILKKVEKNLKRLGQLPHPNQVTNLTKIFADIFTSFLEQRAEKINDKL